MKVSNLNKKTLKDIFKINDEGLDKLEGYDLDLFAVDCSKGIIDGVDNEDTLSSVDAIYIKKDRKMYKIEAKDISRVIYSRIKGYTKCSMVESYIQKSRKGKNKPAIDMKKKIIGTTILLSRLEDTYLYEDKGFFLLLNDDVTHLLIECDELERMELEEELLIYAAEIKELESEVLALLKTQNGFEIYDVRGLCELLK